MSKFNAKRKVPKSRKHLLGPIENPKLPTKHNDFQLEMNKTISRGSKYLKKLQSKMRKIIGEE